MSFAHSLLYFPQAASFSAAVYMSLQPKGIGHIAFGADPVSVRVASCLHSISWTNGWILTKLAQTHYWEGGGGGGKK